MRIVLVSFHFGEYNLRLAGALAKRCEVLLMLPNTELREHMDLIDSAVTLRSFDGPRLRQPVRQVKLVSALCKEIKEFAPDVVHLQHGHLWFNLLMQLPSTSKLVVTIHDLRHHIGDRASQKTPQWVLDRAIRRADHLIVHARQIRDEVIAKYRISRSRVHIIRHIKLGNANNETDHQNAAPTVLFFGRIWPYKGLQYLIRAEPLISAEIPDVQIVIAGEGEDFSRYRRMMRHPERFVVHDKHIPEQQARELFRHSDVVVLPYVEASQSGVIPLAYTFSKPVVATTVGGLPEMVEHLDTGLCVPPGDERALAEALIELLRNRDLAQAMGRNGNLKVNAECSPDEIANETLAVYEQALRFRPSPTAHPVLDCH